MITADVAATQALTFAIPIGVLCRRARSGVSSSGRPRPQMSRRGCRRAAPRLTHPGGSGASLRCGRRGAGVPGPAVVEHLARQYRVRARRCSSRSSPSPSRSGRPRCAVARHRAGQDPHARSTASGRPARRPAAPPPGAALVARLHRRRPGRGRGRGTRRGRSQTVAGTRGWRSSRGSPCSSSASGSGSNSSASPPLVPRSGYLRGRSWPRWPCGSSGSSPT